MITLNERSFYEVTKGYIDEVNALNVRNGDNDLVINVYYQSRQTQPVTCTEEPEKIEGLYTALHRARELRLTHPPCNCVDYDCTDYLKDVELATVHHVIRMAVIANTRRAESPTYQLALDLAVAKETKDLDTQLRDML